MARGRGETVLTLPTADTIAGSASMNADASAARAAARAGFVCRDRFTSPEYSTQAQGQQDGAAERAVRERFGVDTGGQELISSSSGNHIATGRKGEIP